MIETEKSFRDRGLYEKLIVFKLFMELAVSYGILSIITINTKTFHGFYSEPVNPVYTLIRNVFKI
jgi:hypothetical protein